ncbi:MAG: hypothetical protein OHK0026_00070 [Rhodocyclaceae bacterium]
MSFALPCDPALAAMLAAAMSVIFLLAAWNKLRELATFEDALAAYRLLPAAWVPAFARLLPALEAIAGAGLLFASTRQAAAGLAAGLLLVVSGAVATNLARGLTDIECGCGSPGASLPLSAGLVARNAVLALALAATAQQTTARALQWIDYVTVAGGTLALLGLYAACNQLLANRSRALAPRTQA